MAPGFWSKLKDFGKKVFNTIAPIAQPILQMIPHPAAQAIGMGVGALNNVVNRSQPSNQYEMMDRINRENDASFQSIVRPVTDRIQFKRN